MASVRFGLELSDVSSVQPADARAQPIELVRKAKALNEQQALSALSGCFGVYQSEVHSQTLPIMSRRPYPFGGKVVTGDVRS